MVHRGYVLAALGISASSKQRFEAATDTDSLRRLREGLDRRRARWPSLLLLRLREDHFPDLPPHKVMLLHQPTPAAQLRAYEAALDDAWPSTRCGSMLEALPRLRTICLHPNPQAAEEDDVFLAASARVLSAIVALDAITDKGKRAAVCGGLGTARAASKHVAATLPAANPAHGDPQLRKGLPIAGGPLPGLRRGL